MKRDEQLSKLIELGIPDYMHEGILAYVHDGRPTGSFLRAVLTGNFREMCNRADNENQKKFYEWGFFLYNYAPMACWGSEENVTNWINHKGMKFEYPREPDPRD